MNSLIKTTIKRPVTVCVLVVILLAVGVLATLDMSTNLLPNIKMPMMGVTVVYPGAGAQSVEDGVTVPLENALQTIPGITELETKSFDNVSVSILTFNYGANIDEKIDAIEDALKTVTFPEGCQDPIYTKVDMNGTAAATLSVYNTDPNASLDTLASDAQTVAQKLRSIEGVGSVSVLGKPEKQVKITALQGLDITALAIVQALSTENLDLPLGTILQNGAVVSIRNASDATSVTQIMQLPVSMDLGAGVISSLTSLQNAVKVYATCTMQEFEDYVQKALDARQVIDEIDGKSGAELEELQDSLTSLKSLMALVRENTSYGLEQMWNRMSPVVTSERFKNMSDEELQTNANQYRVSFDVLKWARDEAASDTLESKWQSLVDFRKAMEAAGGTEFTGGDITYEQFATLFQDGGEVTVTKQETGENGEVTTTEQTYAYAGLDLLHSEKSHEKCETTGENACERETFTLQRAADTCEFADSVNTVAFQNIIDTVKDAEEKQNNGETVEEPIISDELFAALFINSTQGSDFAALMSPQVIHVIRLENFNADVNGKESIVRVLRETKTAHVKDGIAVYKNGEPVTKNDDGNIVVVIDGTEFTADTFGRLRNKDGKLVNADGQELTLTDKQIAENFYTYGGYRVFDDSELLTLYNRLGLDGNDMGITPTLDTIRFMRISEFGENADKLIVPVAYVGNVEQTVTHQAYAQYNGMIAVTIEVYSVSGANTTQVVEDVKKAVANVSDSLVGQVTLLDDKAEFITDSISNVLSSIIIGGVLAVLVIYLFVGKIGSSLVVSITMPLSVLVALLGLWAMNISLNLVSLGGLAVGIGMLVDNSIVVLESITKRRDRGESVFDSCLNGTREVAGSLLASTITNVCVFFPILFAQGLTREIFYDLVWAVLFSIVMSLIVAVTVIPSLYHLIYSRSPRPRYKKDKDGNKVLAGTFEDGEPRGKSKALFDADISVTSTSAAADNAEQTAEQSACDERPTEEQPSSSEKKDRKRKEKKSKKQRQNISERKRGLLYKMENGYGELLSKVLKSRVIVCVVALVVFAASVGLVFTTGMDFIPSVDKGVIEVNMRFDGSATLEDADADTKTAMDAIRGEYGDGILYSAYTVGKQGMLPMNNSGVIRIHVDTAKLNTAQTADGMRTLLSKTGLAHAKGVSVTEIDGVVAELTGEMAGQSVTLVADDMEKLSEVSAKVAEKLLGVEGIRSVTDNTAKNGEQYSFVFDKDECAKRNVNYQNAVMLLRVGMSGYDAANLTIDGQDQTVNVIFKDETKNDVDALLNVIVGFDNDGAVKISDVLKKTADGKYYETENVVSVINKRDGKFITSVDIESFGVDMGTMNKRVRKAVAEVLEGSSGVTYEEGGVSYYLNDAMQGLVISLIAAFLLLYGVLACQFESLIKPLIVIVSIPFSFTGGFLALVITGTTLNVVSFVGVIMLMGVIVNGAIVMIDKIDQLIKDGIEPKQAVIEGCKSRLRPILMTTLTTVLALTPLAIGIGRGSEFMQPMGIVVLGGLLLGTLVTLVLIPCFYCIVKRIKFTDGKKDKKTDADKNGESETAVTDGSAETTEVQTQTVTDETLTPQIDN